jgi:hypothetical protein
MPGVAPAYFGLNDTHIISGGFSLHVDIGGSFVGWTSTNVPTTHSYVGGPGAPAYVSKGSGSDYGQYETTN